MKKHEMEAVASALAKVRPRCAPLPPSQDKVLQWHKDCEAVAKALGDLNHMFDVARFMRNCGVPGWIDGGNVRTL